MLGDLSPSIFCLGIKSVISNCTYPLCYKVVTFCHGLKSRYQESNAGIIGK